MTNEKQPDANRCDELFRLQVGATGFELYPEKPQVVTTLTKLNENSGAGPAWASGSDLRKLEIKHLSLRLPLDLPDRSVMFFVHAPLPEPDILITRAGLWEEATEIWGRMASE